MDKPELPFQFRSGNEIPVERAVMTRKELDARDQAMFAYAIKLAARICDRECDVALAKYTSGCDPCDEGRTDMAAVLTDAIRALSKDGL